MLFTCDLTKLEGVKKKTFLYIKETKIGTWEYPEFAQPVQEVSWAEPVFGVGGGTLTLPVLSAVLRPASS